MEDKILEKIEKGSKVEFTASRILKGNPIKGTVVGMDEEWIDIKLAHYIEGINNWWNKDEVKSFRLCLINGDIKII